jgi:sugar lactone lactonase YvrE
MKTLMNLKLSLLIALAALAFGCNENLDLTPAVVTGPPHDPSKPIEVSDFIPKEGTSGQQMIIYGKNFGTDPSLIRVCVGETEAIVISSNGSAIYCLVPNKSANDDFDGFEDDEDEEYASAPKAKNTRAEESDDRTVHVAVGAHGYYKEASLWDKPFTYKRAWKVRTIAGKVNEKNENDFRVSKTPQPFSDCGNFPQADNFIIDPVNDNHMWVSCDTGGGIRLFDLEKKEVTFFATAADLGASNDRVRKIEFTKDGLNHMLVATDQFSNTAPTIFLVKRSTPQSSGISAFKRNEAVDSHGLISTYACNGLAVHPVTNSIFFNKFSTSEVYKFPNHTTNPELKGDKMGIYNWVDGGTLVKSTDTDQCQMQFGFGESNYEMLTIMHPSGKFMYVLSVNLSFISKTFYNATADTFGLPVWFISSSPHANLGGAAGFEDNIGMNARVNKPRDGVFVKNPAYAGQEDEYDFYFTDSMNHCIRKITPHGIVTTFAGRGRVSEGNAWGYADGLARGEAMFDRPFGIAYSPSRDAFYIGDTYNKRIREIYFE